MKSILISIKPKWVAKISNGEKTIEIRKTCPELFKRLKPYEGCSIDVYIYCTKGKEKAFIYPKMLISPNHYKANGKVVAKFTLNKVEEIKDCLSNNLLKKSCLNGYELADYLNFEIGYAWHIENLVIFDKPRDLREFYKLEWYNGIGTQGYRKKYLKRPPQSWCYVEE